MQNNESSNEKTNPGSQSLEPTVLVGKGEFLSHPLVQANCEIRRLGYQASRREFLDEQPGICDYLQYDEDAYLEARAEGMEQGILSGMAARLHRALKNEHGNVPRVKEAELKAAEREAQKLSECQLLKGHPLYFELTYVATNLINWLYRGVFYPATPELDRLLFKGITVAMALGGAVGVPTSPASPSASIANATSRSHKATPVHTEDARADSKRERRPLPVPKPKTDSDESWQIRWYKLMDFHGDPVFTCPVDVEAQGYWFGQHITISDSPRYPYMDVIQLLNAKTGVQTDRCYLYQHDFLNGYFVHYPFQKLAEEGMAHRDF